MDHEKYYKIMPDGTYSIHFLNKKQLSKEEINKIFSSFGNVIWNGDINGFTFIKYRTLQEVSYCLESLQKNKNIRILPQKNKINKSTVQSNSNELLPRTNNLFQETSVDKQRHSYITHNNKTFICEEKSAYGESSNNVDNFSYASVKAKYDYSSHVNAIESPKLNSIEVDKRNSQCSKEQKDNKVFSFNRVTRQQQAKLHRPLMSYSVQDKNIFNDNKISSLIPEQEIKPKESDIKIDHLSLTCAKNTSYETIITMQEVIVANIHMNYGVHYILHLFEKHSPISATLIKTIHKTDIRYCFVYFINTKDASAIEKEFDNFALSGRNLIVLRKS